MTQKYGTKFECNLYRDPSYKTAYGENAESPQHGERAMARTSV